jgi:hypothetical protein
MEDSNMVKSAKHLICLIGGALTLPALAGVLPTPHFSGANPQVVYSGTPDFTDSNGRVAVYLKGEYLSPDNDLGHPSGWIGGYQHVMIRGISAGNRAGAWVRCVADNGCITYGGAAQSVLILGLDPARYLGERASHLQVRMWVSNNASDADDPAQPGGVLASDWSNIWTVDAAAPGTSKPAPVAEAPVRPVIARISPAEIAIGDPKADYRIRIYGATCGEHRVVVFNGDASMAIAPEESNCRGYDDDNSLLPKGTNLIHVTIPERYRLHTAGSVEVTVQDAGGRSNTMKVAFAPRYLKANAAPWVERPVKQTSATVQSAALSTTTLSSDTKHALPVPPRP